MYILPQVSRRRRMRRQPALAQRAAIVLSTFLTLVMITLLFVLTAGYASLVAGLPAPEALATLLEPPNGLLLEPTRLYDRTGQHVLFTLKHPGALESQYLTLDTSQENYLPDYLVKATLANSQPDFWDSPGYSLSGLISGEHPTLAQRLVFDLLLRNEPDNLYRAGRERLLAAQITSKYGRAKILEWYLNSVGYGPLVYGADAAARAYFNKPAAQLTLAEAALLVAQANMPEASPVSQSTILNEHRQRIIQEMLSRGWISPLEARQALEQPTQFAPSPAQSTLSPAFNQLALTQAQLWLKDQNLYRGGMRIITSLDYELQLQVDCIVSTQLARLKGLNPETMDFEGNPCQATRLLITLPEITSNSAGNFAGSLVVMEPRSGQIRAIVGSTFPGSDPTRPPGRPAGTTLTPLIYLTAFSRGFSPASLVWDLPPANFSLDNKGKPTSDFHGPVRLRTALANDYLGPAETLLLQLDRDSILRTAGQLGLSQTAAQFNSSLDSGQATLLELTQLYATFANQGIAAGQAADPENQQADLKPTALVRVESLDRQVLLDWSQNQSQPLVSNQLAYLINHVLSDEIARWPSLGHPNLLEIGRPAAVKSGRTDEGYDGWTIGYTPRLAIGVWLGSPENSTRAPFTQASAAVWRAAMQFASHDQPAEGWAMPAGISTVAVCDPSGLLPTTLCPSIVAEVFPAGTEPTQNDTLFRQFQINRETGHLATVFTPPEIIEQHVYMIVPPEAVDWARQAGLPIPPDTYDPIYVPPSNPDVQLSQPALFDHVHGKVAFRGTATGKDFQFYRLQVGQGLNPTAWMQIGEDAEQAVKNGTLGEWDTKGLSGLYAVQLLVVHKDQRVESAITQVTIDNHAPTVRILAPQADQIISSHSGRGIIFQAEASDDLQLSRVEFYVDDQLVGSLVQGPFNLAWTAQKGPHTLRVRALDLAGNASQAALTFTVK